MELEGCDSGCQPNPNALSYLFNNFLRPYQLVWASSATLMLCMLFSCIPQCSLVRVGCRSNMAIDLLPWCHIDGLTHQHVTLTCLPSRRSHSLVCTAVIQCFSSYGLCWRAPPHHHPSCTSKSFWLLTPDHIPEFFLDIFTHLVFLMPSYFV